MSFTANADPQSCTPIVFETETAAAQRLAHSMRGHMPGLEENTYKVEQNMKRLRGVLGACGVDLVSVPEQPKDVGVQEGKFVTIGMHRSWLELQPEIAERVPDVRLLPTRSFWDKGLDLSVQTAPFVLKDTESQRGEHKLLISRKDQIPLVEKWREAHRDDARFVFRGLVVEPYVQTPGNVDSSYRVVVTATGHIIAAGLLYAPRRDDQKMGGNSLGQYSSWGKMAELVDPKSPLFLDSQEFRSNVAVGGNILPLTVDSNTASHQPLTGDEKRVLKAHGIKDQKAPEDILRWSQEVARAIGPGMALLTGIDFIQGGDKRSLLEVNPVPGVDLVRREWGLSQSVSDAAMYDRLYAIVAQDLAALRPNRV